MALTRRRSGRESAFLALSLVVLGATVGVLTVVLSLAVDGAAELFSEYPSIVWLLPVAGFATYGVYRALRLDYSWSTSGVMEAVHAGRPVPAPLALAIVTGTSLTVLCGGSVGKEAAALQMGAAVGGVFHGRAASSCRKLFARAAMAAALGAMLGTPLTGAVFCFESLRERPDSIRCVVAPLVSTLVAWGITEVAGATFLDRSELPVLCDVGNEVIGLAIAIGLCAGLLSMVFCSALGILRRGLASLGAPVFALAVGGVATALIIGYADLFHYEELRGYCGTGAVQVEAALLGEPLPWWAFLAKMALTLLTLAGGFKGGEIMPVLAIGACLGATLAPMASGLMGANMEPLFAAVAMAAFFAACTNCPLTALMLMLELFGADVMPMALLATAPAYLIARSVSLYPTTLRQHASKLQEKNDSGASGVEFRR